MPILPLVLVNGADGIGTGWSTSIPNYSPRDIVANLQALLDGRPITPMKPWYKVGPRAAGHGWLRPCQGGPVPGGAIQVP